MSCPGYIFVHYLYCFILYIYLSEPNVTIEQDLIFLLFILSLTFRFSLLKSFTNCCSYFGASLMRTISSANLRLFRLFVPYSDAHSGSPFWLLECFLKASCKQFWWADVVLTTFLIEILAISVWILMVIVLSSYIYFRINYNRLPLLLVSDQLLKWLLFIKSNAMT